jgi:hypothetical protein
MWKVIVISCFLIISCQNGLEKPSGGRIVGSVQLVNTSSTIQYLLKIQAFKGNDIELEVTHSGDIQDTSQVDYELVPLPEGQYVIKYIFSSDSINFQCDVSDLNGNPITIGDGDSKNLPLIQMDILKQQCTFPKTQRISTSQTIDHFFRSFKKTIPTPSPYPTEKPPKIPS